MEYLMVTAERTLSGLETPSELIGAELTHLTPCGGSFRGQQQVSGEFSQLGASARFVQEAAGHEQERLLGSPYPLRSESQQSYHDLSADVKGEGLPQGAMLRCHSRPVL